MIIQIKTKKAYMLKIVVINVKEIIDMVEKHVFVLFQHLKEELRQDNKDVRPVVVWVVLKKILIMYKNNKSLKVNNKMMRLKARMR